MLCYLRCYLLLKQTQMLGVNDPLGSIPTKREAISVYLAPMVSICVSDSIQNKREARSSLGPIFVRSLKRDVIYEQQYMVCSHTANVNAKATLLINGLFLAISNPHSFGTNFGRSEFLPFFLRQKCMNKFEMPNFGHSEFLRDC